MYFPLDETLLPAREMQTSLDLVSSSLFKALIPQQVSKLNVLYFRCTCICVFIKIIVPMIWTIIFLSSSVFNILSKAGVLYFWRYTVCIFHIKIIVPVICTIILWVLLYVKNQCWTLNINNMGKVFDLVNC